MKLKFTRALAAIALTTAALVAAPAAALAYAPNSNLVTLSATTVAPGGSVDFSIQANVFQPGEPVTITVSGQNSEGASLAMVGASTAYSSTVVGERTAEADGSLAPVTVKFPEDASGIYTIKATSPTVTGGVSASVTVSNTPADGGTSTDGPMGDAGTIPGDVGTTQEDPLPATGMNNGSLMAWWVGCGALLLAGGVVLVATTVRKNREKADIN